jgi:predicted nucleic acid-binding protein
MRCDGWRMTLNLADRFRLTLYDAAYLELADRRSLPLASLDEELRAASRAIGFSCSGDEPTQHNGDIIVI